MDALVARRTSQTPYFPTPALLLCALCFCIAGCQGKSLVDDHPVFAEAPPRRSLSNRSTLAQSPDKPKRGNVLQVSESISEVPLTGNTVVATVNGHSILLDDLVGSMRLNLEASDQVSPEQRQQYLLQASRQKLDGYIDQEIVLDALSKDIDDEKQEIVKQSLEEPFQEVLTKIKADRKVETNAQLNELLANEGLSIDLLRESFIRMQMVNGYLATKVKPPSIIDRKSMLEYYREHVDEFTTEERVRCQEISILFREHDGKAGAEIEMSKVLKELRDGADFGEVAMKYSDSLSAEQKGDMGWIVRDSLADKKLEERLFSLSKGERTKIFARDNAYEIYHVVAHEEANTSEFSDVQRSIEQLLKKKAQQESREAAMKNLRDGATIVTMFDDVTESAEKIKLLSTN